MSIKVFRRVSPVSLEQRRAVLQGIGAASVLLAGCGGGNGGAVSADPPSPPPTSGPPPQPAPTPQPDPTPPAPVPPSEPVPPPEPVPRTFAHPGLLHTEGDFARMREKLLIGAQPWTAGFGALTGTGRSHLGEQNFPRPVAVVNRGTDPDNSAQMYIDVARAYQLAVRWKATGDTAYADKALSFLDAWSSTLTAISGNADRFLAAGIQGYQWANAAEIMRSYPGWSAEAIARFQRMLLEVCYPMNHQFLTTHNGTELTYITNYWANWDLCNMASVLAIAVFCDRRDLYDEALSYFKYGRGNGNIHLAVTYVHPGNQGQWQESCRDQGHTTLGVGLMGAFCEMAWNQGDDLYGYDNNRFLAGVEYAAKSNLQDSTGQFYSMPFTLYRNRHGVFDAVSPAGLGHRRPVWESIYHHYVNRKGIDAPYTARQVALLRPEGDGGNGDQLGVGTLTFAREPYSGTVRPSGLLAQPHGSGVILSWWGCVGAERYIVKRSASMSGPYAVLASNIVEPTSFMDGDATPGTRYYVITAMTANGESEPSDEARVRLPADLVVATSVVAGEQPPIDASKCTLMAGASWGAGRAGQSLVLNGTGAYVALPEAAVAGLGDVTIACWVHWNGTGDWARIFDFGSTDRRYMALTTRGGGVVRFMITINGGGDEDVISGSAFPTARWAHVAVTLSGSVGRIYVDGLEAGRNESMRFAPFRLGATIENWIGRSRFAADAFFDGRIEDFRIYHGALDAAAIAALAQ
jgi:hypothetical protein